MQEHLNVSNNLDKQFAVTAPNKVWMGDTSHVRTEQNPEEGVNTFSSCDELTCKKTNYLGDTCTPTNKPNKFDTTLTQRKPQNPTIKNKQTNTMMTQHQISSKQNSKRKSPLGIRN